MTVFSDMQWLFRSFKLEGDAFMNPCTFSECLLLEVQCGFPPNPGISLLSYVRSWFQVILPFTERAHPRSHFVRIHSAVKVRLETKIQPGFLPQLCGILIEPYSIVEWVKPE
jgi:hypothetical protein